MVNSWLNIGLPTGLEIGLGSWLILGLFLGVTPEQVEDQDRRVFNQGIRRTLRNSLVLGLLSGGVIWVIWLLSIWLSPGLSTLLSYNLGSLTFEGQPFSLSDVLNPEQYFGLSVGWQLGLIGSLLICAMMGGLTVLHHIVLRILLWRRSTFPWQAAPFLEDACARIFVQRVGGGYRFIHRLLLDYFADLQAGTQTTSPAASPTPSSTSIDGISRPK